MSASPESELLTTPLHALHLELGARMVPFAGYSMPVQYPAGLMAEHRHTREAAGLFDVSHMGQLLLRGPDAAAAFESLMPVDVIGLGVGKQRYGLLLTEQGTIRDDLMFFNCGENMSFAAPPQEATAPSGGSEPSSERGGTARFAGPPREATAPSGGSEPSSERGGTNLFVIVNGACKVGDLAHIQSRIGSRCEVISLSERGLLALQGPKAVHALSRLLPGVDRLVFMTGAQFDWQGGAVFVTRSGYTGEDGFEISVQASQAEALARALLAQPEVKPIGLGARNSLRLEAGLCLYGNDIDTTTTPVEAGLTWAIQKVRRSGGAREGGFPGAPRVLGQLQGSVPLERRRVGLLALERVPVREHTELQDSDGKRIGEVTSGLLGPSIDKPIAMGYVLPAFAAPGTRINAMVRGKPVAMEVAALPFVPTRYHRA